MPKTYLSTDRLKHWQSLSLHIV